jgi:HK97 family phage portal protein
MFGWLGKMFGRQREVTQLRALVAELSKAMGIGVGAAPGPLLAGGPLGYPSETAMLSVQREEERHNTGWVYSSVKTIAQRIARQPVKVARRIKAPGPSGRKQLASRKALALAPAFVKNHYEVSNLELVECHPFLEVIKAPNPIMVGWSLIFCTICELELTGKCFWWHTREEGEDVIYPLPPSWVEPKHTLKKLFDHYIVRPYRTGEQFEIPGADMSRFYYPDPTNPVLGAVAPLITQSRAVVADEAIQEAQARAFKNGIFPGLAVVVGRHADATEPGAPAQRPYLTKEQRQSIIEAIKQGFRGVKNYDEPIILDALIEDVKKISQTCKEMDFINSGKTTKERVTQGFGVNPIVMGQIQEVNRASATVADEIFCHATINPKIDLISQCLQKFVVPRYDDSGDLLVWIEEARASDPDQRRADWDQLIRAQAVTKNELRTMHGLEPLDAGGDQLVSPAAPAGGQGAAPPRPEAGMSTDETKAFIDTFIVYLDERVRTIQGEWLAQKTVNDRLGKLERLASGRNGDAGF